MPTAALKHSLVATLLMAAAWNASALTTSSTTYSDQELQAMLAQSQPLQPATAPAAPERLHIGLSDPDTQLVLPWFLAEVVDAINQRTPLQALPARLKDGI